MKKVKLVLLSIIFLTFIFFQVLSEDLEFPVFFMPSGNIVIDGNFNDWPVTLPFILDSHSQIVEGLVDSSDEHQGIIYCFFDKTNLYIFANVTDSTPCMNDKIGTDIWQGDAVEGYVGFREDKRSSYGLEDFQFGITLNVDKQKTWIWAQLQISMKGINSIVVKTDTGCILEAKIPLSNFELDSISPGTPLWIDFAIDNSTDGKFRKSQYTWCGDREGWTDPSSWRKVYITNKQTAFKDPIILSELTFAPEKAHRIYFYHNAKPWQGEVLIGDEKYTIDEKGGIELEYDEEVEKELYAKIGGKEFKTSLKCEIDRSKIVEHLPVKRIKVNQFGYHAKEKKEFIITLNDLVLESREFQVVNVETGQALFTGKLSASRFDHRTNENIAYGDFTGLTVPGRYVIKIKGVDDSYKFKITNSVFSELFYTTMRSFYMIRCGMEIDDSVSGVYHKACHTRDAKIRGTDKVIDTTGGWHDAGDFGKWIPTGGVVAAQLLLLYEKFPDYLAHFKLDIPESNNKVPDMIDEVKYELDWMLKMQQPEGGVYHKVNSFDFPGTIVPEDDRKERFVYDIGTNDTGIFCGTMALSARVFLNLNKEYSEKLKNAAIKAGDFLLKNEGKIFTPYEGKTGGYLSSNTIGEHYWAFAELFRLTGDEKYLKAAEKYEKKTNVPVISWDDQYTLGIYTLLKSGRLPRETKEKLLLQLHNAAVTILQRSELDGYRVVTEYNWGSNRTALGYAINLLLAYDFFYEKEYLQVARKHLNYLLGMNVLSKCFITGIGSDPPQYPENRFMEATKVVIPGLLVNGPNNEAHDGKYPKGLGPRGYIDNWHAYSCNETAIDSNGPLVFVVGYFMCLKDKSILN